MKSEQAIQEFWQWYLEHKNTHKNSSMEKKMEFFDDTLRNMVNLMTYMIEDIQQLKRDNGPRIVLPSQLRVG